MTGNGLACGEAEISIEIKRVRETNMYRQAIEYGGIPVGIAVPQNGKLRFIAVKFQVIDLDNQLFTHVGELQAAIRNHVMTSPSLAA
jgi:hypothetical protein